MRSSMRSSGRARLEVFGNGKKDSIAKGTDLLEVWEFLWFGGGSFWNRWISVNLPPFGLALAPPPGLQSTSPYVAALPWGPDWQQQPEMGCD